MSKINAGDLATTRGLCEVEDGTKVRVVEVRGNEADIEQADGAWFALPGDEAPIITVEVADLRYLPQARGIAQTRGYSHRDDYEL